MKKLILILTLIFGAISFSANEVKAFDSLNIAAEEYRKVLQELVNFKSREEFNEGGDNLGNYLKSSGNTELEKKWETIKNKIAEPYEIKANSPKMKGTNGATVDYDVYGYDEGKLIEVIDHNIQEFVQQEEDGTLLIDMEKYLLSVEEFVNKTKKIKVAVTTMEFEKVSGKWMLKEKGEFEN